MCLEVEAVTNKRICAMWKAKLGSALSFCLTTEPYHAEYVSSDKQQVIPTSSTDSHD